MKQQIIEYYNEIAEEYHDSRFSNSYGQFIHKQESVVLDKYLNKKDFQNCLDLACGTGRFLEYASHGIDISENMLKIAKEKYPNHTLQIAEGKSLPFENKYFKNVFSFHLMMHLEKKDLKEILNEVYRVTQTKGYFIFDIPSGVRRRISGYSAESWHGRNQISISNIKEITSDQWDLLEYHGVAFFPLHRIPKRFRTLLRPLDSFFCNSIFRELSSHLIIILQKK